jgi:hypothetical protein
MTGVIAAVLCAASGATVYDVTLGETTENTVAFFAGDGSQIRGAAAGTRTADK